MRQAIRLARQGDRRQARDLFIALVDEDEGNELAWLWLVDLVDDPADQIIALENALSLNPGNLKARQRLRQLQADHEVAPDPEPPPPSLSEMPFQQDEAWFQLGRRMEETGRLDDAALAYRQAAALSESSRERHAARQRLHNLERRLEADMVQVRPTTAELLRVSLGPVLLYLLLILVHTAFRPWRALLLLCGGVPLVWAGSLFLAGATIFVMHPWWQRLFGPLQLRQPVRRMALGLAGFTMLLLPYLVFLTIAYRRLLTAPLP